MTVGAPSSGKTIGGSMADGAAVASSCSGDVTLEVRATVGQDELFLCVLSGVGVGVERAKSLFSLSPKVSFCSCA
jgi:hypothetical protein